MRPRPARWFQLLTPREDLLRAMEVLAERDAVELEGWAEQESGESEGLRQSLERFRRLQREYGAYWPVPARNARPPLHQSPQQVMDELLRLLELWRGQAEPVLKQLNTRLGRCSDLDLIAELVESAGPGPLDFSLLQQDRGLVRGSLFTLPPEAPPPELPDPMLGQYVQGPRHGFLLVVGPREHLARVEEAVTGLKGRRVILPEWLAGSMGEFLNRLRQHRAACNKHLRELNRDLARLNHCHRLARALGQVGHLLWYQEWVNETLGGKRFAVITGWIARGKAESLNAALEEVGVRGLISLPPSPPGKNPPMIPRNPWWAKPFQLFVQLLGTPGQDETDPSMLLAVIAPLLFGFMFGDVGQGAVMAGVGWWLSRRWPRARLLTVAGVAAMVFGALYGSVFCLEGLIPALWLHPMSHPLTVLAAPMLLGMGLILLSMGLNGVQHHWQGRGESWWLTQSGYIPIYLGLVAWGLHPGLGVTLVSAGLIGHLLGLKRHGDFWSELAELPETLLQLVLNTVSFARVGAFALAHAGLSQAVVALAELPEQAMAHALILALGNVLILLLEGMVVSVQTTRLILFEFFLRFFKAAGRPFRPLPAPPG